MHLSLRDLPDMRVLLTCLVYKYPKEGLCLLSPLHDNCNDDTDRTQSQTKD